MERQSHLARASSMLTALVARQVASEQAAMRETMKPKGTPERLRSPVCARSRWPSQRLRRACRLEPVTWLRDTSLLHRHASRT